MVKRMMIKIILIFVGFFSMSNPQNHFMPNLPFGEYRLILDKVYPCESTRNHSIKINLYFSKKTSSTTELKGNFTFLIPFDDTLIINSIDCLSMKNRIERLLWILNRKQFDTNLSSWGSTGGWIPNAYILIVKKPCSTLKNTMGKAWFMLLKAFNMSSTCPIPVGVYTTSGIDVMDVIESHNFPKVFFYGKYKAVVKLRSIRNQVYGCMALELSLLRPWEKPF